MVDQLVRVDAGQQFGAAPHVKEALAQQRPQRPFLGRIDISGRDEVGTHLVAAVAELGSLVAILRVSCERTFL
jgi:hypothetical protein